ncbi:MAG: 3-phosphoshikimate 1-carboxyvinyltransferase, partial [Alphaproteobacteria bacterium]
TSHVPHVLAFALALAAADTGARDGIDPLSFAGPSFRSATRVAASSPETWRDVLGANAEHLSRALATIRERIDEIERAARSDPATLEALVARARSVRRSLESASLAEGKGTRGGSAGTSVVRLEPAAGPLAGEVRVPGDKSIAHRALMFGAIADGPTTVRGVGGGEDNASTIRVLRSLGVEIERDGSVVRIRGRGPDGLVPAEGTLDCGNSGTTMRLMAGILAGRPFVSRLDGDASLRKRPMRRVMEPLARMGARFASEDGRPPIEVHGGALVPASFDLPVASAQVKTALVLAGLGADGETVVREPALSRDHTERLLPAFGGRVERRSPTEIAVRGPQRLHGADVDVPGDPSAAAFWLVAGSIVPGSRLVVRDVCTNPTRTGAIDVLRAMGARIGVEPRPPVGEEPVADLVVEAGRLRAVEIAGETMLRAIDEFPVLAVAAALAAGETRFLDAGELRVKESDRIAAMAAGLRTLGAEVSELPEGLVVRGPTVLGGGVVESHGDHRVAMAFAIAALVARAPVEIRGAEAIAVSDPGFLSTLSRVRGGGR